LTTKAAQGSQKRGSRKKRAAAKTSKPRTGSTRSSAKSASSRAGSSRGNSSEGFKSLARDVGRDALSGLKKPLAGNSKIKTPMEAEMAARAVALFQRGLREAVAILVAVVAILMFIALVTFHVSDPSWSHTGGYGQVRNAGGIFGAWFADITMFLFGYMAYVLPLGLGLIGWNAFKERNAVTVPILIFGRTAGLALLLVTACGLADLHVFVHRGDLPIGTAGGGVLGTWVAGSMVSVINSLGATLILLALLLGSITFVTGVSWFAIMERIGAYTLRGARAVRRGVLNTIARIKDHFAWREARRMRVQMGQQRAEDLQVKAPLIVSRNKPDFGDTDVGDIDPVSLEELDYSDDEPLTPAADKKSIGGKVV